MSANCVRWVKGPFWLLDSGFTFEVSSQDLDKDFLGQLLLSIQPKILATSTKSAQKNIDMEGFKRIQIRVPPLDVQRKVVAELAKLDEELAELKAGLEAELAARRKQYEYYRDKLLTFEEAPA